MTKQAPKSFIIYKIDSKKSSEIFIKNQKKISMKNKYQLLSKKNGRFFRRRNSNFISYFLTEISDTLKQFLKIFR
jgi:uncharacterized beta-barrel protein YwiB (DUF1934 family)